MPSYYIRDYIPSLYIICVITTNDQSFIIRHNKTKHCETQIQSVRILRLKYDLVVQRPNDGFEFGDLVIWWSVYLQKSVHSRSKEDTRKVKVNTQVWDDYTVSTNYIVKGRIHKTCSNFISAKAKQTTNCHHLINNPKLIIILKRSIS